MTIASRKEITNFHTTEQQLKLTRQMFATIKLAMQKTEDIYSVSAVAVQEIREKLECDRVLVYQFNTRESGVVLAESRISSWTPAKNEILPAIIFGLETSCEYLEPTIIQSNHESEITPYQSQLLEKYQIKSSLSIPIFCQDKIWGLLVIQSCVENRQWQEVEINLLSQIASELNYRFHTFEFQKHLQQHLQEQKTIAKVIDKIQNTSDLNQIFQTTTKEIRQLIQCDRTIIYRFHPDWSGDFIAESVGKAWMPLKGRVFEPGMLQQNGDCETFQNLASLSNKQGRYQQKKTFVVNDVQKTGFPPCYMNLLEEFEAQAYLIVPIFKENKLWGLLATYQNSNPREWEDFEVSSMQQIAVLLGVAIQQTETVEKLQQQSQAFQVQSQQVTAAAEREKEAREYLQQGAIKLLGAVRPALDGDLTVRAPITEDELGTIADAYNNTLQALRQIVVQVQAAAQQVAEKSHQSNASLSGLTTLANQQSQELNEALGEFQQMVNSTQTVVGNVELVQIAVKQANQTVELGDNAMDKTVDAIQAIRETVAQTGKKIQKLSESSQKISKVVNLISNFATQTNVLALNAAIEATRAGEYGKGFAVVADEVRSLSRQSAAATIEIEKLVQEIQAETGEVAMAMDTGIKQVVEGTKLVSETRINLNAIVTATAEISQLLQKITNSTQGQMLQSVSVTSSMHDVAKIASKTASEANNIAIVFQEVLEMAQELLASVSKFKVN
ncbi:GAF domain-containing protein [Calothrix sp. UHCC 0171]|nr:GAF domain-containing protein [Calothrix sp. UHCC 0171]MEA5573312.1 GAF domain-containing protein [Calothrix sp. UHCC 0171]